MRDLTYLSNDQRLLAAELAISDKRPELRIQNRLFISDKEGKTRPITSLKKAQCRFLSLSWHIDTVWRKLNRIIVLKSRKVGISTAEAAKNYLRVIDRGVKAVVISHEEKSAKTIFEIYQLFHEYYSLPKPEARRENVRELIFQGFKGNIKVFTAGSPMATRSLTAQAVHVSEFAFWKDPDTATALFNAIGQGTGTSITVESTANGEDFLFYPMWHNAYKHCSLTFTPDENGPFGYSVTYNVTDPDTWNGFFPLFIGAIEDEDCRLPVDVDEAVRIVSNLDAEERVMVERLNAPVEFIKWWRVTLAGGECRGDRRIMHQEHCVTPEQAFQVSGSPRFDIEKLNIQSAQFKELGRKMTLRQAEMWDRSITALPDPTSLLTIFRLPQKNHYYVLGLDPAEGLAAVGSSDPDAFCCHVLDVTGGGEQVARISGQLSEDEAVTPVRLLATFYNLAYIVPEEVGGRGNHLIIELAKLYPPERIYHRLDFLQQSTSGKAVGFRTHSGNRNILIDDLAKALTDDAIIIHCDQTFTELRQFKKDPSTGKIKAAAGFHDDDVMSLALAVHGMIHYPSRLREPLQAGHQHIPEDVRHIYGPKPATPLTNPNPKGGY